MNNIRLNIETHKKGSNTISFYADKLKYIKDSTHLHNILKEKLKDRHRIKGVNFSGPKMLHKKFIKNKDKLSDLLDIDEANYLKSMSNYDKLKHEIYVKERKEKEKKRKENIDKELLKKEINYTTLRETIYQFLRFKKTSNLYRANIMKSKNELKLANKISKKNFINQTLKNVASHFNKVKGKVDLGKKPLEESENEYSYKKLYEQIAKSRIKYINKMKYDTEQTMPNKYKSRKSLILNNKEKIFNLFSNNITENNKNDNLSENLEKKESKIDINNIVNNENKNNNKKEKIENRKYDFICKTDSTENTQFNGSNYYFRDRHKNKKIIKHKYLPSDKRLNLNIKTNFNNYYGIDSRNQGPKNMKSDSNRNAHSHLLLDPESKFFNNTLNNPINKQNILNAHILNNKDILKIFEKENIKTNKTNINDENENSSFLNKSNDSIKKQYIKDLKNIEKMKKNNLIVASKKRNPIFWNNNMRRVQTPGFRAISNKVINKPLYTTKIGDLVKEFHRIKSVAKKSKKRMREKHLTTLENIDKIIGVKEDLLMINLKFKYLNCSFPQKRQKTLSKRKIFRNKVTNCIELMDNPLNIQFEKLDNESSNDNIF